jgi:hypothetical protein
MSERDIFVQRLTPAVMHRPDRLQIVEHTMRVWRSEPDHAEAHKMLRVLQAEQSRMQSATLRRR